MEYVLQGKKGNGKGIIAMRLIERYIQRGRPIATNMDIFLEHLLPPESKTFVYRLPDLPTSRDMEVLGTNPTGGDETKNGLIVLDECASWLNSRDYKNKDRHALIDWFLHSRKFGWDVVYIIQNINMLDKQFRDGFAEHLINAQRLDRLPIPIIGGLISLFGGLARLPKIHVGVVRYGTMQSAPVVERIFARGKRFYKTYDTLQRFTPFNEFQGVSCTLPAYHVYGRYKRFWEMYRKTVLTSVFSGLLVGFVLTWSGLFFAGYRFPEPLEVDPNVYDLKGFTLNGPVLHAVTNSGRTITTRTFRANAEGVYFIHDGKQYRGEF